MCLSSIAKNCSAYNNSHCIHSHDELLLSYVLTITIVIIFIEYNIGYFVRERMIELLR